MPTNLLRAPRVLDPALPMRIADRGGNCYRLAPVPSQELPEQGCIQQRTPWGLQLRKYDVRKYAIVTLYRTFSSSPELFQTRQ